MKKNPDEQIDELVEELERLRIERDEATRVYQCAMDQANEKEKSLLQDIQCKRAASLISNNTKSRSRSSQCNATDPRRSKKTYSRAWWNIEGVANKQHQ